jgi:hypothetical protein
VPETEESQPEVRFSLYNVRELPAFGAKLEQGQHVSGRWEGRIFGSQYLDREGTGGRLTYRIEVLFTQLDG